MGAPGGAGLVSAPVRVAHGAADGGLAGDCTGGSDADLGADGFGQDAGGVSGVHRWIAAAGTAGRLAPGTQVVYVSPLKALSNDVQKNLEGPLKEIQQMALEAGYLCPEIRTGVRTGDTPMKDRAAMLKQPPHILVTTPESLYLLLTSAKARGNLCGVHTVIVDEIHAIADDKRGSHLALTLERLKRWFVGKTGWERLGCPREKKRRSGSGFRQRRTRSSWSRIF